MSKDKRVIIIGAGFGGLFAARTLAGKAVEVLLIDANNFHTFKPLLYQVATSALDPSEIAYPVRTIFRGSDNIRFLMGEVTTINGQDKQVEIEVEDGVLEEAYDYLIIATGSVPAYFGNQAFREFTFELNSLEDAIALRNHILGHFERASWTEDEQLRDALTTIVVVGGGPTGLETAGALYELYNHVLKHEFDPQKHLQARVLIVELLPHLLAPYPENLRQAALEQLNSLGVEVILGNPVKSVTGDHIQLGDGQVIATHTVIWTAGVEAAPTAKHLGIELGQNGRIPVTPRMEVEGFEGVFAVGDIAYLEGPAGNPYPMMIPVAKQQGILVARNIVRQLQGREMHEFHYLDRGIMATIGRRRAVAWIYNRVQLRGFIAWLAWLGLHLVTLMGFRNQLNVLINWIWNYFTYDRSVRIILE
jgi:NADH dehydrogenase